MSPFGGWGSSLALGFVLVVAAIKAIWEDAKRHQEDHNTNASVAHRYMPDGALPCTLCTPLVPVILLGSVCAQIPVCPWVQASGCRSLRLLTSTTACRVN